LVPWSDRRRWVFFSFGFEKTSTNKYSAFGGLIAYGVGHINSHVQNWRLLFVIEGIPGFLLGAFCLWWLPDRPLKNSRFNEQQNEVAVARYHRDAYDRAGKIQWKHAIWTLTDWKVYMQGASYLLYIGVLADMQSSFYLRPNSGSAFLHLRFLADFDSECVSLSSPSYGERY
jgi:MFS family permease